MQGDQNQYYQFQMAIAMKLSTSDHMLVEPTYMRLKGGSFF